MTAFLIIFLIIFGSLFIAGFIASVIDIIFNHNIRCPLCNLWFNSIKEYTEHYNKQHKKPPERK